MALSARWHGPRWQVRGSGATATVDVYDGAYAADLSSATYTLYDADGAQVVSAGSATVSGGTASYDVPPAATSGGAFSEEWREEWSITDTGGATATLVRRVVVSRVDVRPTVVQADLVDRHSDLLDLMPADRSDLTRYIDSAWGDIVVRMLQSGEALHEIAEAGAFRGAHIARAMQLIAVDWQTTDDRWAELATYYATAYETEMGRLGYRVDRDQDGVPDTDGASMSAPGQYLGIPGPGRRW